MPNSKQIVYLSQVQYQDLITNGTITVDGVTVQYNENDIYVTPQAEPVTDVRVNGTSVAANGVANIPMASQSFLGVVKQAGTGYSISIQNDGALKVVGADTATIKIGNTNSSRPILPATTHVAAFYGLTRAAGADMKDSDNPVGTYTPEAKGAIQQMLGVSDLIATAENNLVASQAYKVGDVFTANGKLYKVISAIAANEAIILQNEDEEIAGANAVETKVGEGFVKFTDYADSGKPGIVQLYNAYGITKSGGYPTTLQIHSASEAELKAGAQQYRPVVPLRNHAATFYGLAKAAGADEKDSTLPVGQYTDTAKTAIRSMLGATSSNVIAVQDTQPTDTDTKIWLPETAETPVEVPTVAEMNAALAGKVGDVQINGTSIVSNGIANIPIASSSNVGVVKTDAWFGTAITNEKIYINGASSSDIKTASQLYKPITPYYQHESAFYGLAKAAGDTTQAASNNAVGTYTDNAKVAIRTMLGVGTYSKPVAGIPASDLASGVVPVQDVQVNNTSVVSNGVANIPIATDGYYGLVKPTTTYGVNIINGYIGLRAATDTWIKEGTAVYATILPNRQHAATFYGLAKAAGDTTQSVSSNAVGQYTDNAKASIKAMLGVQDGSTGTVNVSGTTPTITAVENTRYVCGEITSLDFTPAASGICIVRFTSGSTVTVLTLPSTVKFPEWFDPTSLETNTIYEICITDGIYGAVMSWAQ